MVIYRVGLHSVEGTVFCIAWYSAKSSYQSRYALGEAKQTTSVGLRVPYVLLIKHPELVDGEVSFKFVAH